MRRKSLFAVLVVILLLGAYAVWCRTGRAQPATPSDLRLRSFEAYGANAGHGNVLCVQPYVTPRDYASRESFYAKTDGYLREAKKRGWLGPKTVVVFPEYYGTWLVVAGEKHGVYTAPSVDTAMKLMASSNPVSFARALSSARGSDRVKDALFRMKAFQAGTIYDNVFKELAAMYQVTIVAGSAVLPSPRVTSGRLQIGDGALENVSVVYAPHGTLAAVIKAFPTKTEQPYTSAGKVGDIPVIDTSAGKVAILVCADAWFPEAYKTVKEKKASVVLVPSYGMGNGRTWQRTWAGYSGFANPPDVSPSDPGRITERQAFMKYSLPGRLPESGIPYGAAVFQRGRMWDIESRGSTVIVRKGKVSIAPTVDGAALVSLWL